MFTLGAKRFAGNITLRFIWVCHRDRHRVRRRDLRRQSHDDPRRTKPALTSPRRTQSLRPIIPDLFIQALESHNLSPTHSRHRGHTRNSRFPINPDRAATTLTLRGTTIFDRRQRHMTSQSLAQRSQQCPFGWHGDHLAVDGKRHRRSHGRVTASVDSHRDRLNRVVTDRSRYRDPGEFRRADELRDRVLPDETLNHETLNHETLNHELGQRAR